LFAAVAAASLSACFIEAGSLLGKQCRTTVDCLEPYVCVAARPNGVRTCELLRGPDSQPPSGGGPYDYCRDVKPLLDKSCLANCHGVDTTGSSQPGFRLDFYAFDAGYPLGAFAKAARVRIRVAADDMPPAGFSPRLSVEERQVVTRWVDLGAPECFATTPVVEPVVDAGEEPDAGLGGDT
jgi:hypothetical protein